jgi:PhnB protein
MAVRHSEPALGVIVPHLVVADVDEAIAFYGAAFGAEELYRSSSPSGAGQHVHLRVHRSLLFLSTEEPAQRVMRDSVSHLAAPDSLGGTTAVFQLRVDDVDAAFQRAVRAGAVPVLEPSDMFWGDRYASIRDPAGHVWALCTVQEVLAPRDVARRMTRAVGNETERP